MAKTLWLVTEKDYEYNDEWYRESGSHTDSVYSTKELAAKACKEKNKKWLRESFDLFELNVFRGWSWRDFFNCSYYQWLKVLKNNGIERPEVALVGTDKCSMTTWWRDTMTSDKLTDTQKDAVRDTCTLFMFQVVEIPAYGFENTDPETAV